MKIIVAFFTILLISTINLNAELTLRYFDTVSTNAHPDFASLSPGDSIQVEAHIRDISSFVTPFTPTTPFANNTTVFFDGYIAVFDGAGNLVGNSDLNQQISLFFTRFTAGFVYQFDFNDGVNSGRVKFTDTGKTIDTFGELEAALASDGFNRGQLLLGPVGNVNQRIVSDSNLSPGKANTELLDGPTLSAVPEPSTFVAMLFGLLLFFGANRQKK